VKKLSLFTPRQALFYHRPRSGFLGLGLIRFSSTPLSHVPTKPRALSVNRRTTSVRRLQGIARPPQDPGPFTVPSSTLPRHPGDGQPLPGHVATTTSTAPTTASPLRHRLRVLGTPRPSLDSIKERAEGSLDKGQEDRLFLHFSDQHLKQHSVLLFS
jgi:hypothetical protein